MTILTDILARKQEEVEQESKSTPLQELELLAAPISPAPDFIADKIIFLHNFFTFHRFSYIHIFPSSSGGR